MQNILRTRGLPHTTSSTGGSDFSRRVIQQGGSSVAVDQGAGGGEYYKFLHGILLLAGYELSLS
jgi:hypothetical protein